MLITCAFFRGLQREDHVAIVLEPYPSFKNGIHRAVEIDPLRFSEAKSSLEYARSFGEAIPIVDFLKKYVPNTILTAECFFSCDDGYPHALFLGDALIEALRVPDAQDIGIGAMASGHIGALVYGEGLWRDDAPESPDWLNAAPHIVLQVAPASSLLELTAFEPSLDESAISEVQEAIELGDLPIIAEDFLSVDTRDEWETKLARSLVIYRDALQRIASHGGWVASWYDRKTGEST
jgi:hypothetical protein